MTRKVTLLVVALLAFHLAALAQCGFMGKQSQRIATDPRYAQSVANFEAKWQNYVNNMPPSMNAMKVNLPGGDTVFEIPVVVHVLDTGNTAIGSPTNPSAAAISAFIDYINQTFAATYTYYPSTSSGGTRIPIRFTLAKRDTNCNASTGITRANAGSIYPLYKTSGINYLGSSGVPESNIKAISTWNLGMYYNIWIVNKIDGDGTSSAPTRAFAQAPADYYNPLDGLVILANEINSFTSTPASTIGYDEVIHALGHAFNLLDVYDPSPNSSGCPPSTNCASTGDRVCDTEPMTSSNGGCSSGTNPCTGSAYGTTPHNFMNNSSCRSLFTPGQRTRMLYTMKSLVSRACFLTSLGATPIGASVASACIPSAHAYYNYDIGPKNIIIADPSSVAASARDTFMYVTSAGYSGDGGVDYIDNTCRHQVNLITGRTYSLVVFAAQPNGTSNARATAYIDFNNNGSFADPGEMVLDVRAPNFGPSDRRQANFTVPTNAILCAPLRMRVIVDNSGSTLGACSSTSFGQTEDYTVYLHNNNPPVFGSVTISDPPIGGNPSCFITQLKFYAVPSTGITVTGYKWYKNHTVISGATTDTLVTSTLANNDTIFARVFFVSPCGIDSAQSNQDTIHRAATVAPAVSIALTGGSIPGCVDDTLTFTVSKTTNPGTAPSYTWQYDNGALPLTSSNSIVSNGGTVLKAFNLPSAGGTSIHVQMTNTTGCAVPSSATSNSFATVFAQKPPTVSIAVTTGTNPGCAGSTITITATPVSGGTAPSYKWYVNNVLQPAVTGNSITQAFNNSDQVYAVLTSNSPCASVPNATSNTITIVHKQITASVTVAVTNPAPLCDGHKLQFTATPVNPGVNPPPTYQWRINGVNSGTPQGAVADLVIHNNDTVSTILISTDPCVANPRDTSDSVIVATTPSLIPGLKVNLTTGKNPGCLDSLLEFTASVTDMGTGPAFDWFVNGFPVATGNVFSSATLLDGDIVKVRAHQTDGQCYLPDTLMSAPDTMVRSITLDPPVIHLIGNMIITDRIGTFVWFGPYGEVNGETGQTYYPNLPGQYYAYTNNRGCWSRPSNVLDILLLDINTTELTQDVKVYPNPTSGQLNMDWHGKTVNVDITVFNHAGQMVMSDNAHGVSQKSINLGNLAAGIYYIQIKDDNNKSGTIKVSVTK